MGPKGPTYCGELLYERYSAGVDEVSNDAGAPISALRGRSAGVYAATHAKSRYDTTTSDDDCQTLKYFR